ncbi:MAG TPA: sulfite exporter TauE/SafE family protein [Dehalococcoidia bacterium]|nr:sulfite exporter TauE/SafE family protein [Dehalococcoidia bacterium]
MPDWLVWPGLILLGVGVGAYGALIGAGGGFLLVPLLIILYPEFEPEVLTSISLAVVLATAVSGTAAYSRQKRIDYVAGGLLAAATLPGAIGGALLVRRIHGDAFEIAFAVLLLVVAFWLLLPRPNRVLVSRVPPRYLRRMITDAQNDTYAYSFDPWLAVLLALVVGVISSLFGVGGGIFFVPAMVLVMRFPAYIAVATSTFVLMFTAGTGATVHLVDGSYAGVEAETVALALGTVIGGQVGARVSVHLVHRQHLVLRLLSGALVLVSLRQLIAALT